MKDGARLTMRLGHPAPSGHLYAALTIEGQDWVFEFPIEDYAALQFAVLTPSGLR
jgi:hypothetical protein